LILFSLATSEKKEVRGMEIPRRIEIYCTGTCGGKVGHFGVIGYKVVEDGRVVREEVEVIRDEVAEPLVLLAAFKKAYTWVRSHYPGAVLRIFLPKSVLSMAKEVWERLKSVCHFEGENDILEEGTDPELERKVREKWEEECRKAPSGPERPASFDVTQRMDKVGWLAKWTLGFLIANTPYPEEALAATLVVVEVIKRQYKLTRESREALRKLVGDLDRELRLGGLLLTGQPPKPPGGSAISQASTKEEEPNYYY